MSNQPFIRGEASKSIYPLQASMPAYRPKIVKTWLDKLPPREGMILCPFGGSPQVAVEAARSGYQLLIPVHNPILQFVIESLAHPPTRKELTSALAKLAASYKGKERLQPLILSLYETDCPQCGRKTTASSFIWSRKTREPVSKTCRCSRCGEETTADVTQSDIQKALAFAENSPTHARALTRVAAPDDPIRFQVENALASYPPRSVYALFTILNKLTGSNLSAEENTHLESLLLHAFYRCSQPFDPQIIQEQNEEFFQEENVWQILEEAPEIWSGEEPDLPVTIWPALPPDSGGNLPFPGKDQGNDPPAGKYPAEIHGDGLSQTQSVLLGSFCIVDWMAVGSGNCRSLAQHPKYPEFRLALDDQCHQAHFNRNPSTTASRNKILWIASRY